MQPSEIDLIAFMGQSNMAGCGSASEAARVPLGHGYEFRAISDPSRLFPLTEPFGRNENSHFGIDEPGMKTVSLVSSFVNACYAKTQIPVVAVSAAKGGSSISEWMPGTALYGDAAYRLLLCEKWLQTHSIRICRRAMLWCQGCSDGDLHTDPDLYYRNTLTMLSSFRRDCNLSVVFLIRIGNHREQPELYAPIQRMQERLARDNPDIVLVSRCLSSFAKRGLMKDSFHYLQEGYNLAGEEAGSNAGSFLRRLS